MESSWHYNPDCPACLPFLIILCLWLSLLVKQRTNTSLNNTSTTKQMKNSCLHSLLACHHKIVWRPVDLWNKRVVYIQTCSRWVNIAQSIFCLNLMLNTNTVESSGVLTSSTSSTWVTFQSSITEFILYLSNVDNKWQCYTVHIMFWYALIWHFLETHFYMAHRPNSY